MIEVSLVNKEGQEFVLPQKVKTETVHLTNFKQVSFPLSWAAPLQVEVWNVYKGEKDK